LAHAGPSCCHENVDLGEIENEREGEREVRCWRMPSVCVCTMPVTMSGFFGASLRLRLVLMRRATAAKCSSMASVIAPST
jgi:hypothetical protein